MYYPKTRKIYAELARKYGTTIDQMADICRAPLEFTVDVMNNKADKETVYFPSIRITNWGVFYVSEGRKNYVKNIRNKRGKSNREEIQS